MLLIDTKTGYRWLDEWKSDLWNVAGIPAPPGDDETNEAVVFGYLVAWFLGEVGEKTPELDYLTFHSSYHMRSTRQSLRIFTNGSLESHYLLQRGAV